MRFSLTTGLRKERGNKKTHKIRNNSKHGYDLDIKTYQKGNYRQVLKSYADVVHEGRCFLPDNQNLSEIFLDLLEGESNYSTKVEITPPSICTNSADV